jgi:hypothetical protein
MAQQTNTQRNAQLITPLSPTILNFARASLNED